MSQGNGVRQNLARHRDQAILTQAAKDDPDGIRLRLTTAMLEPWLESLEWGIKNRERWAMRLFAEAARLVSVQPQVAIAVFSKLGVKDESEAAGLIAQVREAQSQPLAQTVEQAAHLLRDWLADHPADRSRLMGVAFGAREVAPLA